MLLSTSTVNDPHFQMYLEKNFPSLQKTIENYFKNKEMIYRRQSLSCLYGQCHDFMYWKSV